MLANICRVSSKETQANGEQLTSWNTLPVKAITFKADMDEHTNSYCFLVREDDSFSYGSRTISPKTLWIIR